MKFFRNLILSFSLACASCAGFPGLTGAPPQAPAQVKTISRAALDVAYNAFDASLSLVDGLMDAGIIKPGTPQAKNLAVIIRKVNSLLSAADTARRLGNEASYEQALVDANAAITEFRAALGK